MDSADALDEIHIKVKVAEKDKGEGETLEGEDDSEETIHDFEKRINLFVLVQIRQFSNRTRDSYKDGLVYQARKAVLCRFLSGGDAQEMFRIQYAARTFHIPLCVAPD